MMNAVVPSDLEGDYVVVGYVDNDAQQPKECFQKHKSGFENKLQKDFAGVAWS